MTEDVQQDAINVASKAIDSYNFLKDIACYIKKEFNRKHNPTWHCIVGRNFGSYITHETKHLFISIQAKLQFYFLNQDKLYYYYDNK